MIDSMNYPRPTRLEADEISDAMWDIIDNGVTTLPPSHDPERWIAWLKRYGGCFDITIRSHTEVALILEGY